MEPGRKFDFMLNLKKRVNVILNKWSHNNPVYMLGTGWLFIELSSFLINSLNLPQSIMYFLVILTAVMILVAFSKHIANLVDMVIRPLMFGRGSRKPVYRYDEHGREVYFNNRKNYWFRHLYDDNGQLLATYDSNNEWTIYVYNESGKRTKLIDSTGLLVKYDYSNGGNVSEIKSRIEEFVI